jgi:hypothetical protein
VSALFERGQQGSSEIKQAKMLTRAQLIAQQLGVAKVFWYEFQAPEHDDLDPESHFGILHRDLSPSPPTSPTRRSSPNGPPARSRSTRPGSRPTARSITRSGSVLTAKPPARSGPTRSRASTS